MNQAPTRGDLLFCACIISASVHSAAGNHIAATVFALVATALAFTR